MTEQLKSPGSGAPSGRGLNWSESFRQLWNRCLKPVLPAAAIALASQVQGLASDLRFKIEQSGSDVVMTASGSIDTSTLRSGPNSWNSTTVSASRYGTELLSDSLGFYAGGFVDYYFGDYSFEPSTYDIPQVDATFVGVTTDQHVLFNIKSGGFFAGNRPTLQLGHNYVAKSPINRTVTYSNKTLTGASRSYIWGLPNGDTVTVEIIRPNTAPVAADVADSTNEDTAKQITLAAIDADNDALTFSIVGPPAAGTLGTIAGNKVAFTPAANASGVVTFTFKANDGTVDSATKTVTVTVNPVNDAPTLTTPTAIALTDTAVDDSFTAQTGTLSGSDIDSNTLSYGINTGTANSGVVTKVGTYGTLTVTSATGAYSFAPNASAINALTANTSETFAVTVSDGALSASANLVVNITAANDTPALTTPTAIATVDTAAADSFNNSTGTLSATDRDTGATFIYGITGGTVSGTTSTLVGNYGTLAVNSASGAYTFAPNAVAINALSANTTENFPVTVSDGTASNSATLAVNITGVNDTPSFSLAKDVREDNVATFTTAEFAAGFVDVENNALGSVTIKSLPVNGVLSLGSTPVTLNQVIVAADLANLKYTPVADDFGAKPFKVVATEASNGLSAPEATINFNVLSVNDAPSASLVVVTNVAGITWYAQGGSVAGAWQAIAASSNGDKLVAGVDGGNLYTSTDAGVTWTARDQARNWQSVASSADGSKLVAAVEVGNIYTSTDSGATWTARDSVRRWQSVASSADGVNLVAVEYNGRIYSSVNSGVVWTARDSARTWSAVASSSSGSNLVAVVNGGAIYTSTDVGTNWVQRSSENRLWAAVASSANGQKLVAAEVNGLIYTSANAGTNWTAQAGSGARFWTSLASSADGSELLASTYGGKLYTSADSGVTWVARDSDRKWFAVAASADGSDLYAAVDGGRIYSSMDELQASSFTVAEDSGSFTNLNYFTAKSVGPANESSQAISYELTNDKNSLFSTQPAIASNGTLTFTPATNANGTATVTIVVRDDGGTANGGVDNASATPLSPVSYTHLTLPTKRIV